MNAELLTLLRKACRDRGFTSFPDRSIRLIYSLHLKDGKDEIDPNAVDAYDAALDFVDGYFGESKNATSRARKTPRDDLKQQIIVVGFVAKYLLAKGLNPKEDKPSWKAVFTLWKEEHPNDRKKNYRSIEQAWRRHAGSYSIRPYFDEESGEWTVCVIPYDQKSIKGLESLSTSALNDLERILRIMDAVDYENLCLEDKEDLEQYIKAMEDDLSGDDE
jgi:hypothetical protein